VNLIVNFTPTGMVPMKATAPRVPITPEEIIADVRLAVGIGITVVHLHARESETGVPTHRAEVYGRIIEGIREFAPELVICVSLSGRVLNTFEARSEVLGLDGGLKPDMASLTLSSLNFSKEASVNSPEMIQALARLMGERGVLPELEVFDIGMVNYARYLERKGLLRAPHYFNLLLGGIAGAQAELLQVGALLSCLPPGSLWSLAGIGDAQLPMNAVSIAMGGGVRVGLEDNIWFDAAQSEEVSNAALLERVATLASLHGREIMPPAEFRDRLELLPGNGNYGRAQT
jgi:3-keto-5-aminohexanoate cleavage enzyme